MAAELGQPIPAKVETIDQWNRWLGRIHRKILGRIPDLDALVASGVVDGDAVADVEAAAVARKALNPKGLRQTVVSTDHTSLTELSDRANSDGELDLTEREWAQIVPPSGRSAWSSRPAYGSAQ